MRGIINAIANLSFNDILHWMKIRHAMRPYLLTAIIGTIVFIIMSILMDIFIPMESVYGLLRAIIALIGGGFMFMLAYSVSIYQSDSNRRHYDDDTPIDEPTPPYFEYRLRYSFRQRRRQCYPVLALLFVIILASSYTHLYTLMAGVVVTMGIAMAAYLRPTEAESVLIANDRIDPRDALDVIARSKPRGKRKQDRKQDNDG